jgi:hypothetical protein
MRSKMGYGYEKWRFPPDGTGRQKETVDTVTSLGLDSRADTRCR